MLNNLLSLLLAKMGFIGELLIKKLFISDSDFLCCFERVAEVDALGDIRLSGFSLESTTEFTKIDDVEPEPDVDIDVEVDDGILLNPFIFVVLLV